MEEMEERNGKNTALGNGKKKNNGEKKKRNLVITIPNSMHKMIKQAALDQETSISALVRNLLASLFVDHGKGARKILKPKHIKREGLNDV